jgi:RNA polymerase sigma-70 factor, ECF subfamily
MSPNHKTEQKYVLLTELFVAGNRGNAVAYHQFLQNITPIIRGIVLKKIPINDSEDTIQEILISIHKARHTYDGKRPLMPWVYAIAQFRIMDSLRKAYAPLRTNTVHIDNFEEILPANVTEPSHDTELLDKALENIPTREQNILTMMHIEGYTAKEIGQKLSLNESAVKVAAHRAIKKLRGKIGL